MFSQTAPQSNRGLPPNETNGIDFLSGGTSFLRSSIEAYYHGRLEESIEILQGAMLKGGTGSESYSGAASESDSSSADTPPATPSIPSHDTALLGELFRLYQEIGPQGSLPKRGSPASLSVHSSLPRDSNKSIYQSALKTIGTLLLSTYAEDPELKREIFISAVLAGDFKTARSFLPLAGPSAESYLYEGLLALDEGLYEEGISRFRTAISIEDSRPAPWYFMGKALAAMGRMEEAEGAFRSALKKDGSFLPALVGQSEVALAQGKIQEGYRLLSRLTQILPRQKEFRDRLALLQEQHPELRAQTAEAVKQKLLRKEPPRILPFSGDSSKIPTIRVALAQHLYSLSFKISSPYLAKWINTEGVEETKTLTPGIYRLFLKEPKEPLDPEIQPLILHDLTGPPMASAPLDPIPSYDPSPGSPLATAGAFLYPAEANSTVLFFDLVTETGSFIASISDRSYRGSFQVFPSEEGFQLINHVNLEEYLYSVLPSEIPASWPMEAVKAQAIAARSYSLAMMARSKDKPFDVYGTTRSASYKGVESEHPRSTEAVDVTRGIYLTTDSRPLAAFYHANNGGYGEGTEAVWGYSDTLPPVPDPLTAERTEYLSLVRLTDWLRGAPPAFASIPGFHYPEAYRWERWVTSEEILSRLGGEAPPGRITAIITRGRGISGRVKEIEIQTEGGSIRLKGDRVRVVLGGLRSTLFTLRVKVGQDGYPEYFIFNGGGWGHGVGLDQSGAAGMAFIGYTAEEILRHYYPNTQLKSYLSMGPTE